MFKSFLLLAELACDGMLRWVPKTPVLEPFGLLEHILYTRCLLPLATW